MNSLVRFGDPKSNQVIRKSSESRQKVAKKFGSIWGPQIEHDALVRFGLPKSNQSRQKVEHEQFGPIWGPQIEPKSSESRQKVFRKFSSIWGPQIEHEYFGSIWVPQIEPKSSERRT